MFIVPIFGIPFEFAIGFGYGYEYGIRLGVQNLSIYVDVYGSAYAEIVATAQISAGIFKFGGGISGLLGKGTVGVRPLFSMKNLKVNLDAYIKLQAFSFTLFATITFPVVKIRRIKIKIGKFLKIWFFFPYIALLTKRFGKIEKKGKAWEKHLLKDY